MHVVAHGLWHLGCVTAACLAGAGHQVVGLDPDDGVVEALRAGRPPLFEPGLAELIQAGRSAGRLSFAHDPKAALRGADVLWVTFDTPVDQRDEADVAAVRRELDAIADAIPAGTLVVVSAQVPVGFTRTLQREWAHRRLEFAYVPENLRLGRALDSFQKPDRVVAGTDSEAARQKLRTLFAPFDWRIEWMALESAEMTKHALNAFLATSVAFINEVARICETVGADAKEVEQGLKSEGRIGRRAYLGPGGPFAGGTLARDVRFLAAVGRREAVETPLLDGVCTSNERHREWLQKKVALLLADAPARPVVAVLGLTYRPGTDTLRRSSAVELCRWLQTRGADVRAWDPAIKALPDELRSVMKLCDSAQSVLAGADLAVVCTEWPQFRELDAEVFASAMRRPRVVDQSWFLAPVFSSQARVAYVAPGRSRDVHPAPADEGRV
jgi:UDPglucose 6-dehydrogenase